MLTFNKKTIIFCSWLFFSSLGEESKVIGGEGKGKGKGKGRVEGREKGRERKGEEGKNIGREGLIFCSRGKGIDAIKTIEVPLANPPTLPRRIGALRRNQKCWGRK